MAGKKPIDLHCLGLRNILSNTHPDLSNQPYIYIYKCCQTIEIFNLWFRYFIRD